MSQDRVVVETSRDGRYRTYRTMVPISDHPGMLSELLKVRAELGMIGPVGFKLIGAFEDIADRITFLSLAPLELKVGITTATTSWSELDERVTGAVRSAVNFAIQRKSENRKRPQG